MSCYFRAYVTVFELYTLFFFAVVFELVANWFHVNFVAVFVLILNFPCTFVAELKTSEGFVAFVNWRSSGI